MLRRGAVQEAAEDKACQGAEVGETRTVQGDGPNKEGCEDDTGLFPIVIR